MIQSFQLLYTTKNHKNNEFSLLAKDFIKFRIAVSVTREKKGALLLGRAPHRIIKESYAISDSIKP
jgi:hypothetical protein